MKKTSNGCASGPEVTHSPSEAGDYPAGEAQLKTRLEAHVAHTGSAKAQRILDNWSEYLPKFWQVVPPSEADSPEANPAEKVLSSAQS